ncbi:MAG: carbon monoxide dehydrogenase subunit G [Anaerolineae bacterium]|nr:carbon monoxide dehydrogenase subunit G [Anaerolineae bacterium]
MKIEGEHVFKGPRQAVWEMFRDPEVLASAMPGTQSLKKIDDQHYEGMMNVRIGPVSGSFAGQLTVSNENLPESCTLTVDGRGAAGFAKGVGNVHFFENGESTTLMKYDGEVTIGGTLASVGQRMIDSVSKSMIKSAFETLDKALEARLAAKSGNTPIEFKPPTEAEFAKNVAKDMAGGLTNVAEVRMLLYIVPVALLFLIVALIARGCGG